MVPHYFNEQTSGSFVPGNTLHTAKTLSEYGLAIGANYIVCTDLSLCLQYLYGYRHQPGNSVLSASGNAQMQAIGLGTTFKW